MHNLVDGPDHRAQTSAKPSLYRTGKSDSTWENHAPTQRERETAAYLQRDATRSDMRAAAPTNQPLKRALTFPSAP